MKRVLKSWDLYLMLLLPLTWYFLFLYVPMYGVQIAFRDYMPNLGFLGSPFVGFKHFERFFSSFYFSNILLNTLGINFYSLLVGFPVPIMFALLVHEIGNIRYKKFVQNITYIPHFLSTVVVVSILQLILNPSTGVVNIIIQSLGFDAINFFAKPTMFKSLYVLSGIWQDMGFGAIIYIAVLTGIDPSLYEAATVDGATRFQKMIHISIPSISSTIVIMLLLRCGSIMNIGYEKILVMQNPLNRSASDVISTFVYRSGILETDYSFSAAVGLFNSLCNFALLFVANTLAKKLGGESLW